MSVTGSEAASLPAHLSGGWSSRPPARDFTVTNSDRPDARAMPCTAPPAPHRGCAGHVLVPAWSQCVVQQRRQLGSTPTAPQGREPRIIRPLRPPSFSHSTGQNFCLLRMMKIQPLPPAGEAARRQRRMCPARSRPVHGRRSMPITRSFRFDNAVSNSLSIDIAPNPSPARYDTAQQHQSPRRHRPSYRRSTARIGRRLVWFAGQRQDSPPPPASGSRSRPVPRGCPRAHTPRDARTTIRGLSAFN